MADFDKMDLTPDLRDSWDFYDSRELKKLLDKHYELRNSEFELSLDKPDPLFAVKENLAQKNIDEIAVVCALLAYGNAGQILKTLRKLDFSILGDRDAIKRADFPLYRFQTSDDIKNLFLALNEIIANGGIKRVFIESYKAQKERNMVDLGESSGDLANLKCDSPKSKRESHKSRRESCKYTRESIKSPVICGINAMIDALFSALQKNGISNPTQGLKFLIGQKAINPRTSSPLKRWNLFLRWVVRKDKIDLGLWGDTKKDSAVDSSESKLDSAVDSSDSKLDSAVDSGESKHDSQYFVDKADLILPLDTHTFRLSKKLNLLGGKTYNLHSAMEITKNLSHFCASDPVKYDFAIYRLGQERLL